jgi:hypothetical protein
MERNADGAFATILYRQMALGGKGWRYSNPKSHKDLFLYRHTANRARPLVGSASL